MEVVVESVADHQSVDSIKLNEVSDNPSSVPDDVCDHKSNGVAESVNVAPDSSEEKNNDTELGKNTVTDCNVEANAVKIVEDAQGTVSTSGTESAVSENSNLDKITEVVPPESTEGEVVVTEPNQNVVNTIETMDAIESESKNCYLGDVQTEEIVESDVIDPTSDNVRFETEILVETNDVNEVVIHDSKEEIESPSSILSELGQNIELSEVLRSSDVTENVENNNCQIRQEVFNKEELLDILEGNDEPLGGNRIVDNLHKANMIEAQIAVEQITRLKSNRKHRHSSGKDGSDTSRKRNFASSKLVQNKEESIVNALVKDWDDDDPIDDHHSKVKESASKSLEHESVGVKEETTVDSSTGDGQTADLNKNSDDSQPQRRLGRVIKKKVIFDPDNPDTFTKSKTQKIKETENEKDQHPPKKVKLEQISPRANSKSPVSKMQWKKPPPKNSKQNKRLSEVDRLLMDEGAVNMIYQLTPEAPKGRKNMKTKAEFIKKLQSSTPESTEMKFRERKKESMKGEEGEAKKILSGKQRSSLSSSIKSPSVSEDFETHSADDSIIYRRHSSSSYSSSCMSPRRLSDVEVNQAALISSQLSKDQPNQSCEGELVTEVIPPDSSVPSEIINKDDCMSIKKKLNSKLSLALNKRKRETGKTDKPIKKKVFKNDGVREKGDADKFKFVSLTFDQKVAEICIRKPGFKYNIEVLKEMVEALTYVDNREDVSVTLLTSECGALCSDLDLTSLLDNDIESRNLFASQIADNIRSVLTSVKRHSKVVCCGVWAACSGVGLGLVALSDVSLAAERASFARPAPALAALRAGAAPAQAVVNDLVIFGRQLSASEALENGIVSRVLWPGRVIQQIQAIAKDIAQQLPQGLLLKKKLLKLGETSDSTFLSQLESEVALMVEYWTSEEGQEVLRADIDNVH